MAVALAVAAAAGLVTGILGTAIGALTVAFAELLLPALGAVGIGAGVLLLALWLRVLLACWLCLGRFTLRHCGGTVPGGLGPVRRSVGGDAFRAFAFALATTPTAAL
jgi:hypothetical protein